MNTPLVALIAVSTALTILGKYRSPALLYFFKPLTIGLIILLAWLTGSAQPDRYFWLILAGLAFSAAGDVFLMLPRDRFVPGLVSFLIAHLLYIAAFSAPAGLLSAPLLALPYLAAAGGLLLVLLPKTGRLALPVGVYAAALAAMGWQAASRWDALQDTASLCAMLGAILFLVSDGVLAINRFVRPFRAAELLLLSTYFAAQTLIALSV
ncbi:MAG TPA: lysoplasmalogenase [Nevskiales bacterium]|nr:lysoplasmalogenase [Nevskiales bacterium]